LTQFRIVTKRSLPLLSVTELSPSRFPWNIVGPRSSRRELVFNRLRVWASPHVIPARGHDQSVYHTSDSDIEPLLTTPWLRVLCTTDIIYWLLPICF